MSSSRLVIRLSVHHQTISTVQLNRLPDDHGGLVATEPSGYRAYIFTGNLELAKQIGLRSSRRLILFNAQLECRLLEFELYAGTRDP